jgi:hypothetical protein
VKTLAALLLALVASSANAQVYKSVTPDGRVTYGDKPVPGAKVSLVDIDKGPIGIAPVTPEDREALGRRLEQTRTLAEERTRGVDEARRALEQAEAALKAGEKPLPGERTGIVERPRSRLNDLYWARQQDLQDAVAAARKRLEEALRR